MNWLEQGGGAFPLAASEQNDAQFGMSLRDWFAGQALAGIMSNPAAWLDDDGILRADRIAYDKADAMIKKCAEAITHD